MIWMTVSRLLNRIVDDLWIVTINILIRCMQTVTIFLSPRGESENETEPSSSGKGRAANNYDDGMMMDVPKLVNLPLEKCNFRNISFYL